MCRFAVSGQDGLERIRGRLSAAVARTGPGVRDDLYRDAGGYMVRTVIPLRFRDHGPGWPAVRRGGSPLMDTKVLSKSNDYRVVGQTLEVGNTRPQARLMNRGGDVVPKNARFLAIPCSPPLSITEARVLKPRSFAGAFVLMKGPEGPGLYRKTSRAGSSGTSRPAGAWTDFLKGKMGPYMRQYGSHGAAIAQLSKEYKAAGRPASPSSASQGGGGTHGVEKIFAFVKSVHIKQRLFLYWGPAALDAIMLRWKNKLFGRAVPSA